MAVNLVFLGRLEDLAGGGSRSVPALPSLAAVLECLEAGLREALAAPGIKLAINGTLMQRGAVPELKDGDEIAFLPPVSGG